MEGIAHALSSSRRLAILETLLARGTKASQRDLREALEIPASKRGTLNKDIRVLEDSGLLLRHEDDSMLALPASTARALQALAELDREVTAERARLAAARAERLRRSVLREETRRIA